MRRLLFLVGLVLACAVPAFCQQEMVFEAEECSTPATAWGNDITPKDRWNLWSKDNEAAKKWSGGKVLQSPPVMQDRATPEEGAPVLHTVLTGIAKGDWFVSIQGGRDLGISLDGKEWKRLSALGGRVGKFSIQNGKFDFWVDDRYADKTNPGFAYYDTITLIPALSEKRGVANGNFAIGRDFGGSGWSWFSRDNTGGTVLAPEGKDGSRCARVEYSGEKDWAVTNSGRLNVKPGQTWVATAWMKCRDTASADLCIVSLSGGKLLNWNIGSDGVWGNSDWVRVRAVADIPNGCDQIYLRVVGNGKAQVWVDDVALEAGEPAPPARPKTQVTGWAQTRVNEKLDRGLIAQRLEGGQVYLGWRLLRSDPAATGFNLYRAVGRGVPVRLNAAPLTRTTDYVDAKPPRSRECRYWVRPVRAGKEGTASLPVAINELPYQSIKLKSDTTFQKVGIADLNGDGALDYVIKLPGDNIDPADSYWTPSPDTYKLEAYLHDGTFLWRKDLGWSIERGIWYSPYLVYDLDGDGKAEVAVKTGEGDPRGADGRVRTGPEYLSILDGMTGKEKAKVAWPKRETFGGGLNGYNFASRNQLGIAFLDGKTPCLLVARGTYTVMQLIAYQFHGGKLAELWRWDNREETVGLWRGQGAHWMHSADVDGDGRDEVILGSCVVDDNGKGLWTTGLGHPDRCFVTDIDPAHPGLEIFYHIEPPLPQNGLCVVDARTGKILWGLQERTYHVGIGMAADIDPTYPGCECWAGEDSRADADGAKWHGFPPRRLLTAKGEMLARDRAVPPFCAIYWDADPLRELVSGGRILKYNGPAVADGIEGSQVAWADVLGDWREEIITSVKGELRIYSTTIPAADRRPCLMQDPIYRHDVAHLAMGYPQSPCTTDAITPNGPMLGLNAPASPLRMGEPLRVKAVLTATRKAPVSGTLRVSAPAGLTVTPTAAPLHADAGGTATAEFTVQLNERPAFLSGGRSYSLNLNLEGETPLAATASLRAEEELPQGAILAQAEAFAAQDGGAVQIRTDKPGVMGKCFSHWDNAGHWLSWKIRVPAAGEYLLALRYCTPIAVRRAVQVDAADPLQASFPATGGFSGDTSDWAHGILRAGEKPVRLSLQAGEHTIKLTNQDGQGMNLDYLALLPADK